MKRKLYVYMHKLLNFCYPAMVVTEIIDTDEYLCITMPQFLHKSSRIIEDAFYLRIITIMWINSLLATYKRKVQFNLSTLFCDPRIENDHFVRTICLVSATSSSKFPHFLNSAYFFLVVLEITTSWSRFGILIFSFCFLVTKQFIMKALLLILVKYSILPVKIIQFSPLR